MKQTTNTKIEPAKCPECGSTDILGLMNAFWVRLDSDEVPIGQWSDWSSNTDLGEARTCLKCDHEWNHNELHAAARDMLAALQAVLASATPNETDHPTMFAAWQKAKAAIEKATGK